MAERREAYNPLLKSYPDSEKVNAVSEGAETLFTRLIAQADDAGRYYGDPGMILAKLYSARMCKGQIKLKEVESRIEELKLQQLIVVYSVNGKRYLEIVNPRRLIRSDARPNILFPGKNDSGARIESPDESGTAHGETADHGTAQEKPKPLQEKRVTEDDGNATIHETDTTRLRDGPGKFTIGRTQTRPDQTHTKPEIAAQSSSTVADADVRGKSELPDGFVRFWAAWPKHFRKQGRARCLKHWRKHKLESLTDAIVAAVNVDKKSRDWLKADGEFVPLPFTWLNRTPWETDPEELIFAGGHKPLAKATKHE